jgi:hypothetical protein
VTAATTAPTAAMKVIAVILFIFYLIKKCKSYMMIIGTILCVYLFPYPRHHSTPHPYTLFLSSSFIATLLVFSYSLYISFFFNLPFIQIFSLLVATCLSASSILEF